jgi:hypothetical protein
MAGTKFSGAQSFWTDELEAEVARRWNDGASADEVADWLGVKLRRTISRNAVIGKVKRMRDAGVDLRYGKINAPELHRRRVERGMERTAKLCGEPKPVKPVMPPKAKKQGKPSAEVLPLPKKTGFNFGISSIAVKKAWQRQGRAALARAEANQPKTGITIYQLTRQTCRAPAGGTGADMLYCGEPVTEHVKSSYCPSCHTRMFTGTVVTANALWRSVRKSAA